ncbi:oligosaccharide flippase family protein [Terrimonas sp. NA20]|uniref:Oligosaccharide flippase family protein n=1 Tax=Terrimonas ginsenosidimutans TaxID=2908004 RepID=A0ABS9KR46_9BACT|nr:oligosaccharide flippase family protein [Terrimonas ginsenosidimutans]MCG2614773.1 oligosaccharide flippase family protein [Terrimonas ginsenosidimutans]
MPEPALANIKRNFFFNFLLSCAQVLFPLFSIPYISRVLDPEGVGRVGFIDSFTYYFIVLAELGITVYGIREVASRKNDVVQLRKLVSELLFLHLVSSLVALIFYAVGIAVLWEKIGDTRLILFSALFFVVNFFSCDWYFIGREKFGFITLRTVVVRLLALLSIFLLIHKPDDYYIYYGIIAAAGIASIVWNLMILLKETPVSFRSVNWKQHLPKVLITYLIAILYSIPIWLDNVLLGLVSTVAAVGYYAFAVKLIRTGTTLLTDSFLVFFPRIVSLADGNDEKQLQEKLRMNIQFIILLAVPMGAGLYLLAGDFTHVFYGNNFTQVQQDLKILALFPLLKGVSLFLSNPVLIAHRFERIFLNNLLVGSVFFVVTAILLGYWKEDSGICVALIMTEVLLIILNYLSVRRVLPLLVVFDWKSVVHAMAGASLFIPVIYLTGELIADPALRLIISALVCMLAYFTFITFIARNEFALRLKTVLLNSMARP